VILAREIVAASQLPDCQYRTCPAFPRLPISDLSRFPRTLSRFPRTCPAFPVNIGPVPLSLSRFPRTCPAFSDSVCYERMGLSPEEIVTNHPTINLAQVHAALSYYVGGL
jgi:Protein of unknown function (DUF433)